MEKNYLEMYDNEQKRLFPDNDGIDRIFLQLQLEILEELKKISAHQGGAYSI